MKITKKEFEKVKKLMPVERKPAKISNQQFLNALLYMVENGCKWRALPKKSGIGTRFICGLADWQKTGAYSEFLKNYKNKTLSKLKVKFCAWTALASRSIQMPPEPEKSVANKALVAQKGANNEDPRGLCIWKICLKNKTFSRKPSRRTRRPQTYRVAWF